MKNNILITGGHGQLANAIKKHSRARGYLLMPCSSQELDITRVDSIENAIKTLRPAVIINTAAYTAVDKAEQERDQAARVNQLGAQHLAKACEKNQIHLIHLSTDYVFDGESNAPYREDDQTNPINFYGKSKWLGEQAIREHSDNYCILRVSGVFSEFGHNFLKTILRLAREKTELRIVADQTTCPTYAGDIAGAIFELLEKPLKGTYHFCSGKPITWHAFGSSIIAAAKHRYSLAVQSIIPITTSQYKTPAERPRHSVLDCAKFQNEIGVTQPSWENGILNALAGLSS